MPTTLTTDGGTSIASPDTIPFNVDPITGVTINPNYNQDFSNPTNNANNIAAFQQAYSLVGDYSESAAQATIDWYGKSQSQIQDLLSKDNTFNQSQKLSAVEYALPGARQTTLDAIDRGNTYASGRLISSIDDRAFESVSRSMSADSTFLRGFGDDSTVGRKASDLMSAKDRLGVAMMGESSLQNWLQTGNQMFVDQPIKSTVGAMAAASPTNDVGANQLNLSEWLGGQNMISATSAMTNATGLATTQAQYDLQTQMFNSSTQLESYYAQVADEQSKTNALQNAYNQEANTANLQMQIDAQQSAQDAQSKSDTTQAVASIAMLALMFA